MPKKYTAMAKVTIVFDFDDDEVSEPLDQAFEILQLELFSLSPMFDTDISIEEVQNADTATEHPH